MNVFSKQIEPLGRRERIKQHTREVLLQAAKKVFSEIGYGAACVRDIVGATDLAPGTFYNYFKSKAEIYQALRDEAALAIRPKLRQARREATSVDAFIRKTFEIYFEYVVAERNDFRFMRCGNEKMIMRLDTPEVIAGFEELREDIVRATALGIFPRIDADYLMAAIVGIALEIAARMLARTPPDPKTAAAFASTLVMNGVHALPVGEAGPEKLTSAALNRS